MTDQNSGPVAGDDATLVAQSLGVTIRDDSESATKLATDLTNLLSIKLLSGVLARLDSDQKAQFLQHLEESNSPEESLELLRNMIPDFDDMLNEIGTTCKEEVKGMAFK